jgi:hypothetical protein
MNHALQRRGNFFDKYIKTIHSMRNGSERFNDNRINLSGVSMKRAFLFAILLFVGTALSGCGSMCNPKQVKEEPPPPAPAVVKPAPQPPPPPQPAPLPKKDRN